MTNLTDTFHSSLMHFHATCPPPGPIACRMNTSTRDNLAAELFAAPGAIIGEKTGAADNWRGASFVIDETQADGVFAFFTPGEVDEIEAGKARADAEIATWSTPVTVDGPPGFGPRTVIMGNWQDVPAAA